VTPPAKTLPARPNNGKLGVAKVPTGGKSSHGEQ